VLDHANPEGNIDTINETLALAATVTRGEFMLDIPSSFTYHTPPVPQDSDVAWCVEKLRNMLR
jgi:hypothetical protein